MNDKYTKLTNAEEATVIGGKTKYYPNGVYCNTKKGTCKVNWARAWSSVGGIIKRGWIQDGPFANPLA